MVVSDATSSDFEKYRTAYNSVMVKHLKKMYDRDLFTRLDRRVNDELRRTCSAR